MPHGQGGKGARHNPLPRCRTGRLAPAHVCGASLVRCVPVARLAAGPHVHGTGKGRKERATPLTRPTVAVLRTWLAERAGTGTDPLFPTRTGAPQPRRYRAPSRPLSREHRYLTDLLARRHGTEGAGNRPGQPARHRTRPLPPTRRADGLPQRLVIAPTKPRHSRLRRQPSRAICG